VIFKEFDLKSLFQLMQEYEVSELSFKDAKTAIEIKRAKEPVFVNAVAPAKEAPPAITNTAAAPAEEKEAEATSKPESPVENYYAVIAPLVGTFYRASAPDAAPFVEVGDKVKTGDVLCIVEAMKSMNEIQSDVSGVIMEICVNNAELVQFDQVLFKIQKNG
jgi:acetyl-CoA carboxylase biotin carboxyl carrier protein